MDLFRILLKRVLYKIPLKLLIIILIVVMLSFICFNAKVYATDIPVYEVGNTGYQLAACLPNSTCWDIFTSYTEYTSGLYHWIITTRNGWTCMAFWLKSYDVKFYNNGTPTSKYSVLPSNDMPCQIYYWKDDGSRQGDTLTNWDVNWNTHSVGNTTYYLTDVPVYTDNTFTTMWWTGLEEPYTSPYIVNTTGLTNWSFDNLYISLGSEPYRWTEDGIGYEPTWWTLDFEYNDEVYTIRLDDYRYYQEGIEEEIFKIPRNILSNYVILRNGANVKFGLSQYNIHLGHIRFKTFLLDSWVLSLTAQEEQEINEDSEKQVLGSIDSGISNMNNNITNVNNNLSNISDDITDSDIDNDLANDFADLSDNFSVVDPTSLDEVFNILYGAFCEDEVINLSFTIPFVNKQVIISSDNISSNYPQALKSFVSVCSWGVIGLFVLKDIRNIINKIAEGSPEDVGSDVKKEVL